MPNPPYSGFVVVAVETQDGISVRAFAWDDMIAVNSNTGVGEVGMEIPPSPVGFLDFLRRAKPTRSWNRHASVRSAAKTYLSQLIDSVMPDTTA
jgi:hypothetical protein